MVQMGCCKGMSQLRIWMHGRHDSLRLLVVLAKCHGLLHPLNFHSRMPDIVVLQIVAGAWRAERVGQAEDVAKDGENG